MTRTAIPLTTQPSSYVDPRTAAITLADIFVAPNTTDGNEFASVGREVLLAWNQDAPTDAVLTVETDTPTPASGNFKLAVVLDGVTYTTANIAYNAAASAVATALLAATDSYGVAVSTRYPNWGGTNTALVGSGGALPTTVTITARYALAGRAIAAFTPDNSGLGGGTYKSLQTTPGAGDHHLAVSSVNDPYNRTQDFTAWIGAGQVQCFPYFQAVGWRQTDNNVYVKADNSNVYLAVVRVPSV